MKWPHQNILNFIAIEINFYSRNNFNVFNAVSVLISSLYNYHILCRLNIERNKSNHTTINTYISMIYFDWDKFEEIIEFMQNTFLNRVIRSIVLSLIESLLRNTLYVCYFFRKTNKLLPRTKLGKIANVKGNLDWLTCLTIRQDKTMTELHNNKGNSEEGIT